MGREVHWPIFHFCARRVRAEKVIAPPIARWSDRSGSESAATVRACVLQERIDTRGAERALIAANARLGRSGR